MLESLTIFSKGGLIHYQYKAEPSLLADTTGKDSKNNALATDTNQALSEFVIKPILWDPAVNATKFYHIAGRLTFCWHVSEEFYTVALYPDILFEGPRQYLKEWCTKLVATVSDEYNLYYESCTDRLPRPDTTPFDKTFQLLLQQSKGLEPGPSPSSSPTTKTSNNNNLKKNHNNNNNTGGKAKRNWHDGNAKVTKKAMDALDYSAPEDSKTPENSQAAMERALQEARQAYLPTPDEEQTTNVVTKTNPSAWSSSHVAGLLQQLAGTKVLSEQDLERPLAQLKERLTQQNVATEISQQLVDAVKAKLVGKKLQSLYRIQTAVQQALESVVTRVLERRQVDLLRLVRSKSGSGASFLTSSKKRPFVISIMGINGIGKTTTVAKLAYYFAKNKCKPLLVAGDTFRSGAVEQLKVHADCLQVPIFAQGYAKDPSAVAAAAIQQAQEQGNGVVLIDTAGRMQNNVGLMKALTKLVQENRPDFTILVAEALVGHDGLDQFQLFSKAAGRVDGLILTKMDTVDQKVGAALTLTHQTGTPVVFCGTGQKYHHLQPLSVPQVVQSLLSGS